MSFSRTSQERQALTWSLRTRAQDYIPGHDDGEAELVE